MGLRIMKLLCVCLVICVINFTHGTAFADKLRIAVMQDEKNSAENFKLLAEYLKGKGIEVSLIYAENYPFAAKMFSTGIVDAMFSSSGVAAVMMMKDLAVPAVRHIHKDGTSTYKAVIIAPKNSPKYTETADYFKNKKVVFTPLASAGEFYFYSIQGIASVNAIPVKAVSHDAAIGLLAQGAADIAIVKNHVWNKIKSRYPNLAFVGEDDGENPEGPLIFSKKVSPELISKVTEVLLSLKNDDSQQARAVRDKLDIQGFVKTTNSDFKHTFELLKKAGVDKSFNFTFK